MAVDTNSSGHRDLGLAVQWNCRKTGEEDMQDSQMEYFELAEDKLLGSWEVDMQNHSWPSVAVDTDSVVVDFDRCSEGTVLWMT